MLLKQFQLGIPGWVFTWPMILISIGIIVGIANRFKDMSWFVLIAIGTIFLLDDIFPGTPVRNFIWPGFFMLLGLWVIYNQQSKKSCTHVKGESQPQEQDTQKTTTMFNDQEFLHNTSIIDTSAIFGGVKQRIVSKNFKGGGVVAVFGGADINLSQADIHHPVEIEVTAVCGGVKLIVPMNWKIKNESSVIFGGIDDKRPPAPEPEVEKVLVIKGFTMFGGIEIRSFK